jgi:hypothetical protein
MDGLHGSGTAAFGNRISTSMVPAHWRWLRRRLAVDSLVERLRRPWFTPGLAAELQLEAAARIAALEAENARLRAYEQAMPWPYDVLTRQEYRDAKGNWRSLINQMNNAYNNLRLTKGGDDAKG